MSSDPTMPIIEPEDSPRSSLTVLITAIAMAHRDGSTMYIRDLAVELAETGHRPIVYTPEPGAVSVELADRGIEVVDRLAQLERPPDVIHGNHTLETAEAVLRLPGTPAVFVCHGLGGWMAEPPELSAIAHWVAVGTATFGRLTDAGLPPERCWIVPNGVDTERFRLSERRRPARPERALVFSNNAAPGGYLDIIERVCAARGIQLDVAGRGVGRPLESPAEVLGEYDLVFARGRCAREAISCGCAVVVVDMEGQGALVTMEHLDTYDLAAFGVSILTAPHDEHTLGVEVDRYDPIEAARVSEFLRERSSLHRMVARLVELYRDAVTSPRPADPLADLAWLLDELPTLSRIGRERDEVHLARHLLQQHALELQARVLHAEPALAVAEAELAELRATRTFRARERLLGNRWVRAGARALRR